MKKLIKLHVIGGARPNFVKIAPLLKLLDSSKFFKVIFINTGQHYDKNLSDNIMRDLSLRKPDLNIGVGSGSHIYQISTIMKKYEKIILTTKPNLVIVFGDVNSTVAAALTAKKMGIKVAHIEAGLRCYDDDLTEEINRRITDSLSDYLFTPSKKESDNLKKENIQGKIYLVGNIMIDSLEFFFKKKRSSKTLSNHFDGLMTFHRPENVDNKIKLGKLIKEIKKWTKKYKIIFPVHPRTLSSLRKFKFEKDILNNTNLIQTGPLSYNDFLIHMKNSKFIITDSGGIQEESTYLGVPCFTVRKNTERPITISKGTNKLVKLEDINSLLKKVKKKKIKISLWDGRTSLRILKFLEKIYCKDFTFEK